MKSVLMALVTLMTTQAFSAAAVAYKCKGVNGLNGAALEFSLNFDTYAQEVGYTNQSITVLKMDGKKLRKPIELQMFGATKKNTCKKAPTGGIYMDGDNNYKDTILNEVDGIDFLVSFRSLCPQQLFEVSGAACVMDQDYE